MKNLLNHGDAETQTCARNGRKPIKNSVPLCLNGTEFGLARGQVKQMVEGSWKNISFWDTTYVKAIKKV